MGGVEVEGVVVLYNMRTRIYYSFSRYTRTVCMSNPQLSRRLPSVTQARLPAKTKFHDPT